MAEDKKTPEEQSAEAPKKPTKPTQTEILNQQTYIEKVVAFSGEDKIQLNKFYRAVLKATQYFAFQSEGQEFYLLEGKVKKTSKGRYIFTPNAHLAEMLEKKGCPALLKLEESRFIELVKLALSDL